MKGWLTLLWKLLPKMDMREMIVEWHLRLATLVLLLGLVSLFLDASSARPNAEGIGDTYTSPPQYVDETVPVDWATLT
jgi:hypothetical protein